jgi:hypothetical protein
MHTQILVLTFFILFGLGATINRGQIRKSEGPRAIPRTWDDDALRTLELPLRIRSVHQNTSSPVHLCSNRPFFRTETLAGRSQSVDRVP